MLTLYHAPNSRSSRIVHLIHEMQIDDQIDIRTVAIPRMDGTGHADPANPHPEGKVPLLVHDGVEIRESNAIILYLTDMFSDSGLGIPVGHPLRGRYLTWLAYYGNVVEPVYLLAFTKLSHPMLTASLRDVPAVEKTLSKALSENKYLCGDSYTAADLNLASIFGWAPDALPQDPLIRDWFTRCADRPARKWMMERDKIAAE
ncbi:hypothetical protein P775_09355 [Puniceibacterium antarcticum]|uniref:Glutathione S-transferase n=1 Tax=Puniceibacterium antarcticum TaxID=1206336 RepID=A0A2G8RGT6_9RHOB|nr:glutathione S-transferase family protein [Puniceibacterium antarcticum]PIL20722.1 hypothetical protein P775_09355 [Puniceibacterium antarcticum]